jgi:tRNA modification GTPase
MDRRKAVSGATVGQSLAADRRTASRDTIFALSSGRPPAGVAVVRISGGAVRLALATMAGVVPEPRRAAVRAIRSAAGDVLDRGLVLFFPGPNSVTGEDVAELHLHGGPAVVASVLRALGTLPGLRPAEAGEFTRRAFDHGRLDLTQVEGLADLIAAETEAQRRQALRQADGALRALYDGWRERLIRARALIEADLDFADEDDIPASVAPEALATAQAIGAAIGAHLADTRGERLRAGAEVVVLGAPNAGKSSLINAVAKRDVAIVAAEPGTTRDLLEVRLDLDGYPVTLVDTAGLRAAEGAVEREGIRRATRRAETADLVVWLVDVTVRGGSPSPPAVSQPVVRVGTKVDLIDSVSERSRAAAEFDVLTSAATGEGIPALLDVVARRIAGVATPAESPLMTRERHRAALMAARQAIAHATAGGGGPLELVAEDLRQAGDALGRITGRIDVEDLLDVIFRDFCIGK